MSTARKSNILLTGCSKTEQGFLELLAQLNNPQALISQAASVAKRSAHLRPAIIEILQQRLDGETLEQALQACAITDSPAPAPIATQSGITPDAFITYLSGLRDTHRLIEQAVRAAKREPLLREAAVRVLRQKLSGAQLADALVQIERETNQRNTFLGLDFAELRRRIKSSSQQAETAVSDAPASEPSPQAQPGPNEADTRKTTTFRRSNDVLVDVELARIAVGLKLAAPLRFWLIARHLSKKENQGSGWIVTKRLIETIQSYNLYTDRHIRRLLNQGEGFLWNRDEITGRLYCKGIIAVATELTRRAKHIKPDLIRTNRPGYLKSMYLPLDAPHEGLEAMIYAGWLAARNDPTISRATLQKLFARSKTTLRRWETNRLEGIVKVTASYGQTHDPENRHPACAFNYVAKDADGQLVIRVRWQLPNTYLTVGLYNHAYHGQGHKVRSAASHAAGIQPPDRKARGKHGIRKRYFASPKMVKTFYKKHSYSETTPRYGLLGFDHRDCMIFEPINEWGHAGTHLNDRVNRYVERRILGNIRRQHREAAKRWRSSSS